MKVENRDTTIRKPTRKSFKKGNTKNVNKYQTLFNNVRTHTLQPAIWTTDAIGNSDHIYVTRNDR